MGSLHCLFTDTVHDTSPDGPFAMDPSSSVLHYAQTLFEGMKAYRDQNGKVTLFRPDMNMKRMVTSAKRLALPVSLHSNPYNASSSQSTIYCQTFDGDALLELIKTLVNKIRWPTVEEGFKTWGKGTFCGFNAVYADKLCDVDSKEKFQKSVLQLQLCAQTA